MERILIHENTISSALSDLTKVVSSANAVADEFEKLNLGAFDLSVFKDVVDNGINNVKVMYLQQLNDDIKRSKIKSSAFANSILFDADNVLKPLSTSIAKLLNNPFSRVNFHNVISFSTFNGRFEITDSDIENLKDKFSRVYIENDQEAIAFDRLKDLANAYTALIQAVSKYNKPLSTKLKGSFIVMDDFIQVNGETTEVNLKNMSWFLVSYN